MRRAARCSSVMRAWMIPGIAAGLLLAMGGCSRSGGPPVRDASQPSPSSSPPRSAGCADVPTSAYLEKLLKAAPAQNGDAANGNPGTRSAWAQQTTSRRASARSAVGQSPSGADSPCTRDRSGLGVSGDTACADHEIPKRVRLAAGLAPTGLPSDEIVYTAADGPSPFAHPLCPNTFRDGNKIGTNGLPQATSTGRHWAGRKARIRNHRAPNDFRTGRDLVLKPFY